MRSINNYSNNKPHDPHGFKEDIEIKCDAVKAITGKFPNGTAAMMALLEMKQISLTWADYCAMPPADQFVWEERSDELNKAMLYLMNLKNDRAKKDLHLAYSQGNMTAYPTTIKGMARYLSKQYPNNKLTNQRRGKKKIKEKGITQNLKIRIVTRVVLLVHMLKILQQMKTPPLLAEELA